MERIARLSPEKQLLLERRLKGVSPTQAERGVIAPRPNHESAPLSFAQRQMWVIDRMTPGNPAYNLPVGYRIKGPLDVTALEDSFNEGGDPQVPHLAVQYADFALWQREAVANGLYASQVEFWRRQLHGKLPIMDLPVDKPRPAFQSFKGSNLFFNVPRSLVQDLSS